MIRWWLNSNYSTAKLIQKNLSAACIHAFGLQQCTAELKFLFVPLCILSNINSMRCRLAYSAAAKSVIRLRKSAWMNELTSKGLRFVINSILYCDDWRGKEGEYLPHYCTASALTGGGWEGGWNMYRERNHFCSRRYDTFRADPYQYTTDWINYWIFVLTPTTPKERLNAPSSPSMGNRMRLSYSYEKWQVFYYWLFSSSFIHISGTTSIQVTSRFSRQENNSRRTYIYRQQ